MKTIREALKHLGYDQEEAYFFKLNRELVAKFKAKLAGFAKNKIDAKSVEKEDKKETIDDIVLDYKRAA